MGEVVFLDIATRLDVPAERVLRKALESDLKSVVIAGYDAEGNEYFDSSLADGGAALWLLERMKKRLFEIADELGEES